MLSIPHMIVLFLVVLVVFGPQKLPELARSFGKLMAEFRKASNDFKNAFEEEMRDLERQARIAELKKQVAEANAAADAATRGTSQPALPAPSETTTPATSRLAADTAAHANSGDFTVTTPAEETVPRSDSASSETSPEPPLEPAHDSQHEPETASVAQGNPEPSTDNPPSHDHQQPGR
jgi:sec-independent protein translocase protein TatB